MSNDETDHQRIKDIMIEVMAVLYEHGIKEAHMGAMMRLLGVDDASAANHDHESVVLDENFGKMLAQLNNSVLPTVPSGTTFH